jgi:hypothetical protein
MSRDLRRFREMEYAVGTDGTITIALKDSAGADLSVVGASASWNVYKAVPRRRSKPWTGNTVLTKTSVAGDIALTAGQAVITIDAADFDGKSGRYMQILQITDNAGNVTHLGMGELFLLAGVT